MKKIFRNIKDFFITLKHDKSKRKKFIIILVILLSLTTTLIYFINRNQFNINRNPRVNMVLIQRYIYSSDVCDEDWVEGVTNLINTLEYEADHLTDFNNFRMLQLNIARNFQDIIDYLIAYNRTIAPEVLVDNIRFSYMAYRNYFFDNIVGGGS